MPCEVPYRDDSEQRLLYKIASCCFGGGSGGAGVSSFNGRTGAVTLLASDVSGVADDLYVNETGDSMTGALSIDNGVLAANDPALELSQTWNNAAVDFKALTLNVTNTAAGSGSMLIDLQQDGITRFTIFENGSLVRFVSQEQTNTGLELFLRKRGTAVDATAAIASGGGLATIWFSGWNGASQVQAAGIRTIAAELFTGVANGTRMELLTTAIGATSTQINLLLSNTGQSQFLDGTAALPALTFQSDTNIGLFRAAADELAFSTSGTERARFISTGLLGVGTSLPKSRVHIVTGGASITLRMAQVETDATGKLGLFAVDHYTNAEEPLCIFYAETNVGDNRLNIGGGRSTVNAATDILFFSAVNTTTTTGTQRMSLNFTDFNMVAGVRLAVSSGANQRAGDAVLVGGTVTVANTSVTANTRIYLTRKVTGGTIGFAVTYTVIAATSFTITSDNALDTSTYSYLLIEVP